jgi:hypothetical protein
MHTRSLATIVAILFASPIPSIAGGLKFTATTAVVKPSPAQDRIGTTFEFVNEGENKVMIQQVESSCGCAVAVADASSYDPGETGKIKAVLTIGALEGLVSKTIVVVTNEPQNNTYTLTLKADIPVTVALTPKFLVWQAADAKTSKTAEVSGAPGAKVELVKAFDPFNLFRTRVEVIGEKIVVTVTPKDGDQSATSDLSLEFLVDGRKVYRKMLLRVLPAPALIDPLPTVTKSDGK